jgi:hypothetical protein
LDFYFWFRLSRKMKNSIPLWVGHGAWGMVKKLPMPYAQSGASQSMEVMRSLTLLMLNAMSAKPQSLAIATFLYV